VASSAITSFPGSHVSRSPDGRWELYSEPPVGDEGHKLQLKAKDGGSVRTLFLFPRHVDSQWAPNSRRIAVTDYMGSDESDCKIVDIKTAVTTSVLGALKSTQLAPVLEGNHHSYLRCLGWRGPDVVEIEVQAYGDANPKGVMSKVRFDARSGRVLPAAGN
jgi:hypothetical protein